MQLGGFQLKVNRNPAAPYDMQHIRRRLF